MSSHQRPWVEGFGSGERRVPFSEHRQWSKLSTNQYTTCAIDESGRLWGWGSPPVGDGTFETRDSPVLVHHGPFVDVSVGRTRRGTYVLAVMENGSLWGWGDNYSGVLGNGMSSGSAEPSVFPTITSGRDSLTESTVGAGLVRCIISSPVSHAVVNAFYSEYASPLFFGVTTPHQQSEVADIYGDLEVEEQPLATITRKAVLRANIITSFNAAIVNSPEGKLTNVATCLIAGGGSGYSAAPQIDVFVVDENGYEASLDQRSEPATIEPEMRFTVVSVSVDSQDSPLRGTVGVAFPPGLGGDTASARCVIDEHGYVSEVVIENGGTYSSIPAVSIVGTGGSVSATARVSGRVHAIHVVTEGEYYDRANRIRLRASPPEAGGTAATFLPWTEPLLGAYVLKSRIDEIEVIDSGDGYTCKDGKDGLKVFAKSLTNSGDPLIGQAFLSGGPVVSLGHTGSFLPDGRPYFTNNDLENRGWFDTVTVPARTIRVSRFSGHAVISAYVSWTGSDRTVQATVYKDDNDYTYASVPQIDDVYSEGLPILNIEFGPWQQTFPPDSAPTDVVNKWPSGTIDLIRWTMGVKYGEPEPWSESTVINAGEYLGGTIHLASPSGGYGTSWTAYYEGQQYPNQFSTVFDKSREISREGFVKSLLYIKEAFTFGYGFIGRTGVTRQPLVIHATGGEAATREARYSLFVDNDFPNTRTRYGLAGNSLVHAIGIEDGGEGYTSEPSLWVTDFTASPQLIDSSRSYSSVVAGVYLSDENEFSMAISDGVLYEWGLGSKTASVRPTRRGYQLEVRASIRHSLFALGGELSGHGTNGDYVSALIRDKCRPQVYAQEVQQAISQIYGSDLSSYYTSSSSGGGPAAVNHFDYFLDPLSVSERTIASQDASAANGFSPVVQPSFEPFFSDEWLDSQGNVIVFTSVASQFIEVPDLSGLPFECDAYLLKPSGAIQSIVRQDNCEVLAVGEDGDAWILDTSHRRSTFVHSVFARRAPQNPSIYYKGPPKTFGVAAHEFSYEAQWRAQDLQGPYVSHFPAVEVSNQSSSLVRLPDSYHSLYRLSDTLVPGTPADSPAPVYLSLVPDVEEGYPKIADATGGAVITTEGGKVTWVIKEWRRSRPFGGDLYAVSRSERITHRDQTIPNERVGVALSWFDCRIADLSIEGTYSSLGTKSINNPSSRVDGSFQVQRFISAIPFGVDFQSAYTSDTYDISQLSLSSLSPWHDIGEYNYDPNTNTGVRPIGVVRYLSELPQCTLRIQTDVSSPDSDVSIPMKWIAFVARTRSGSCRPVTRYDSTVSLTDSSLVQKTTGGALLSRYQTLNQARFFIEGEGRCENSFHNKTIIGSQGGVCFLNASTEFDRGFSDSLEVLPDGPVAFENLEIEVAYGGDDFTDVPRVIAAQPPGVASFDIDIDGRVTSIGVEKAGSGFTSAPDVVFSGGGGQGASAYAVIEGPVGSVHVSDGGSGYSVPPRVSFIGKGVPADATAVVSGGAVSSVVVRGGGRYRSPPAVVFTPYDRISEISITSGGSGYRTAPAVVICGVAAGENASAACEIDGSVTEIRLASSGSGYTPEDTVEISPPDGGQGSAATASLSVDPESGAVSGVTLTSGGSGYQAPPLLRIVSSTGSGASATTSIAGPVSRVVLSSGGGYESAPQIVFQGGGGSGASAVAVMLPAGSGATASAVLSAGVSHVVLTNPGSGYQSSPSLFFTGGGNDESDEALGKLYSNEMTRREYNAHPSVAVAQCKIEGPLDISTARVLSGGENYTSRISVSWPKTNSGFASSNEIFAVGGFGVVESVRELNLSYQLYSQDYYSNTDVYTFTSGYDTAFLHGVCVPVFSAPSSLPGGAIYLDQSRTRDCEGYYGLINLPRERTRAPLFYRKPDIIAENGNAFFVDTVEGVHIVAFGVRAPIAIDASISHFNSVYFGETCDSVLLGVTLDKQFGVDLQPTLDGSGIVTSRGGRSRYISNHRAAMALDNVQGKSIRMPVLLGRIGDDYSIRFGGSMSLDSIRFSSEPEFSVKDVSGEGASLTSSVGPDGKLLSVDFASQGSSYTDTATIFAESLPVETSQATATCFVSEDGGVSHCTVDSPGGGYIKPIAVVDGGGGAGCSLRAVKSCSDENVPSPICCIEVVNPGSGFSSTSPPRVLVYESASIDSIRKMFNDAAGRRMLWSHPTYRSYERYASWCNFDYAELRRFHPVEGRQDSHIEKDWWGGYGYTEAVKGVGYDSAASLQTLELKKAFNLTSGDGFEYFVNGDTQRPAQVIETFVRFDRITGVRQVNSVSARASATNIRPRTPHYESPPEISFSDYIASEAPQASCGLIRVSYAECQRSRVDDLRTFSVIHGIRRS